MLYHNILILLCLSYFIIVSNDGNPEARKECLNLTDANLPPPVVLAAADEKQKFLCKNDLPSVLMEAFSCTVYGPDLIWYFNHRRITSFYPGDAASRTFNIPESSPIYSVTAIPSTRNTQAPSQSRFGLPFCISVLLVQPYNASQIEFEPYNVTCQTHCVADNHTVCQTIAKQHEVAGIY